MANDIEEIKHKLDIVELIGQYVALRRAGANFKGLCPFHEERTPSFMVSPDKQIFKCFGCDKSGDIFTFLQERENLDFPEALKLLADRAGVTLSGQFAPKIGEDKKNRLYKINRLISNLSIKLLLEHPSGKKAIEYLKKRGLTLETIKKFSIGWMPANTAFLAELGRKKGFTENDLKDSGSPERLRGRIIFPLTDNLGNIVGFSGRGLRDDQIPKYLNTPDTIIFHKSNVIYGLSLAKDEIKRADRIVLVEGQMDVVASHNAGVSETVASSGTALTEYQLRVLFRFSQNLIIAFDCDEAGAKATERAIELALPIGFNVKIVRVSSGKDPGDMAIKDPKGWKKQLDQPQDFLPWLYHSTIDELKRKNPNILDEGLKPEHKKIIGNKLARIISLIDNPILQEEYTRELAQLLNISPTSVSELLQNRTQNEIKPNEQKPKNETDQQWQLLGILYTFPELIGLEKNNIHLQNKEALTVYNALLKIYNGIEKKNSVTLKKEIGKNLDPSINHKLATISLELETIFDLSDLDKAKQIIADFIRAISAQEKDAIKSRYALLIHEAETSGDREKVKQLLQELAKSFD